MATVTKFIESGTDATKDLTFYVGGVTTNGTVSSDSTQSLDGSSSLKSNTTSTGGSAFNYTANSVVQDAGTSISFWARFSTASPSANTVFAGVGDSAQGHRVLEIGISTTGKIGIVGRGTTAVVGTVALVANTWYRIQYGYVMTSVSNWSAIVRVFDINGNFIDSASTSNAQGNLGQISTTSAFFGMDSNANFSGWSSAAIMSVWIDSIYINNATDKSDPGNIHVTAKRPFANGTTNGFTTQIGAGGSGYGTGHAPQVNEQPLSVVNGWSMIGAGSAITEEYNIEGITVGDVNISRKAIVDYIGWLYAKSALSETGQIVLNNVTSNISLVNANTFFFAVAGSTTYPAGTGTDIGIVTSTTVTTVSLYECGIVIAYKSATGNFFPFA